MNVSKINKIKAIEIPPKAFEQSNSNKPFLKSSVSNEQPHEQMSEDILSISDEARALLAEDDPSDLNERAFSESELAAMLEQLRESTDPANNPYTDKIKCLQIAMRIINGDKVPTKDRQFLMENEPKLYSSSLLLRRQNDKPKTYKSLLEEDKDDATAESSPVESTSEIQVDESASSNDAEASTE